MQQVPLVALQLLYQRLEQPCQTAEIRVPRRCYLAEDLKNKLNCSLLLANTLWVTQKSREKREESVLARYVPPRTDFQAIDWVLPSKPGFDGTQEPSRVLVKSWRVYHWMVTSVGCSHPPVRITICHWSFAAKVFTKQSYSSVISRRSVVLFVWLKVGDRMLSVSCREGS